MFHLTAARRGPAVTRGALHGTWPTPGGLGGGDSPLHVSALHSRTLRVACGGWPERVGEVEEGEVFHGG